MYKSRRKVLCYVKIPCQWRIFQISRVSIPNQWESNILYSLQSSFCYYPSFGKRTFENTKKLQKNGRRLRKNFITDGVFQIGLVVLMENLSNQRTLGLITETIKGVTVFLDGNDWARIWVPFCRWGNEWLIFWRWQLVPKSLKTCPWVWIIKSTRSYATPWPLKISTICIYTREDAFPLSSFMMKPYPQKGLTTEKRVFN